MVRAAMRRVLAAAVAGLLIAGQLSAEPKEGGEVTSLSWQCTTQGNRATVVVSERYTIFTARGKGLAEVILSETPFAKLSAVEIRSIDATGKVVSRRSLKHMAKFCGYGSSFTLYDANCTYYIDAALPSYPYTVEVDFTTDFSSLFFVRGVYLTEKFPIRDARIILTYPADQEWAYRLWGAEGKPLSQNAGKHNQLLWQLNNLPAIEDISYAPPEVDQHRRLELVAHKSSLGPAAMQDWSWQSAGLFYKALSDPCYLTEGTGISPVASAEEKRELCCRLYQRVVDETRYISVNVGLSGWQPHPAAKVRQVGFGDCKDMTTLLVSYLRAGGIEAYPCLIMTKGEGATDSGFVSLSFNHVITMAIVEGDTVWMDPTCDDCPCGDLPSSDENSFVLAATDNGGMLVRTPVSRVGENRIVRTTTLTIDSTFTCMGKVSAFPTGNFAIGWRGLVGDATPDKLHDEVQSWFGLSAAKYVLERPQVSGLGSLSESISIGATFKGLRPVDRVQNTAYIFPFLYTTRDAYDDLKLAKRTIGLDLGYAMEIIDTVWVMGAGLPLDSVVLPADTTVEALDNRLSVSYARDSLGIRAIWSMQWERRQIDTSQFDEFSAFLTGRRKALERPIKIIVPPPQ